MKKVLVYLVMMILTVMTVYGTGTCSLNQDEPFIAGQIATFQCSCTDAQEQNRAGYIVWERSNGTQISNLSISSGSCQTSVFGQAIALPDSTPWNGSVMFSLNDDGTGSPTFWDDPDDVINDTFMVLNGTITDCVIGDVVIPSSIDLGTENANVFSVFDSITGNPISNINCRALAFAADGTPILVEPYGQDQSFYRTGHDGIGYLKALFDQTRFEPFTTYEFQLICQCINSSVSDDVCYDDSNGERLGYKSCEITSIFTTGDDKRNSDQIEWLNLVTFLIIFGFAFGSIKRSFSYIGFSKK